MPRIWWTTFCQWCRCDDAEKWSTDHDSSASSKDHADDARGREALVRYALRPPIAQERLHILPDNLVRIELKRPFSDGTATPRSGRRTIAIDLDPLSLLCRLAASVPPPACHLVR